MNQSVPKVAVARAFTLVELLAVIALIAVLASLLLPALNRGKMTAQRTECINNLRQLGFATQMYWDDNGGNCFRYGGGVTNGGQIYWFGWIGSGPEGQRLFDATQGSLYPYLQGRGVEICPALTYREADFKTKATGAAYGYGYNIHLSSGQNNPPLNAGRFTHPDRLVVLADAAQVNDFQAPASRDHPMLEEFYYVSANESTTHFRHSTKANATFADGHVDRQTMVPESLDTRLPREQVGRLHPENLVPD